MENIHDKLFQSVFSDPVEASSFLQHYRPEKVVADLDWSTLKPVDKKYFTEIFGESESDLLLEVNRKGTGELNFLYLLFEHQSTADKWMAFRLLKYSCRILDLSFKMRPGQEKLPPILAIVFYQGKHGWGAELQMLELFEKSSIPDEFLPSQSYILVDQTGYTGEDFVGETKARITQALLWAKHHGQIEKVLEYIGDILLELKQAGGLDYLQLFTHYILETHDITVEEIIEKTQSKQGEFVMTGAERYRAEGEARGKAEGKAEGEVLGKLKTILGFLRQNIDWSVITAATGMSREEYEKLAAEMLERV